MTYPIPLFFLNPDSNIRPNAKLYKTEASQNSIFLIVESTKNVSTLVSMNQQKFGWSVFKFNIV